MSFLFQRNELTEYDKLINPRQYAVYQGTCNMANYLSMLVENISKKAEGVWETLGPSTLAYADNTMLFWVKHSSL